MMQFTDQKAIEDAARSHLPYICPWSLDGESQEVGLALRANQEWYRGVWHLIFVSRPDSFLTKRLTGHGDT
jgi:antirestriction protein ArdC